MTAGGGSRAKRADAEAKRGRVETALEKTLATRHEIPAVERASLRTQARAIDTAEAEGDSDRVTRANAGFLELRLRAGLSVDGTKPADAWDVLLAEISRPTADSRDAED